jgi:phosphatidylinositol alpha-1,6-mannosyltransferase
VIHLLVTNDFPPKIGGIQSYLWELWRRLDPERTVVLTTAYEGAAEFDRAQPMRVERVPSRILLPTPSLRRRVEALAAEVGAKLVLVDPAFPLGVIGPSLRLPYGVVLHGAEVTIPGRLPGSRAVLGRVLRGASIVIAAGGYPAAEGERAARRTLPTVIVPPGVDGERFHPLPPQQRHPTRRRFGLEVDRPLVVSVSRLVPRKGMDVLIEASALLAGQGVDLQVAIAGAGRDRPRLERLVRRTGAPVVFAGRISDDDLPAFYGCADVFAMLCRDRWLGLEQEGFGIVFLEAAACGVPQIAGRSGGSHEAVVHGQTGLVVDDPTSVGQVAAAVAALVGDPAAREAMGAAARARAVTTFSYDRLAASLQQALDERTAAR